jgi:hypothetical protein
VGKQPGRGEACRLRDADDCVGAFDNQADAERFSTVLGPRLETFGLERSGAKTRIIPCSRHRQAGKTSCEVRGFELRGGQERTGSDHLKRRTARQKLRASLKRCTAWCTERRHLRRPGLFQRRNAKFRGYAHGLRSPWARRQPARVLQQRHTAFADVAQSAEPTPQVSVARLHRRTGALQRCPTPDRGTTQDETGSPLDLSRRADASRPEEPGASTPHAGIGAGAVRELAVLPR